jgi:hypothetical protein
MSQVVDQTRRLDTLATCKVSCLWTGKNKSTPPPEPALVNCWRHPAKSSHPATSRDRWTSRCKPGTDPGAKGAKGGLGLLSSKSFGGFCSGFRGSGGKDNVSKWSQIMAEMYDDPDHKDHLALMTEGEAMYKLGNTDRAYYVLGRIYEIYGQKGFAGDQMAYLEFYRKEKAARGE